MASESHLDIDGDFRQLFEENRIDVDIGNGVHLVIEITLSEKNAIKFSLNNHERWNSLLQSIQNNIKTMVQEEVGSPKLSGQYKGIKDGKIQYLWRWVDTELSSSVLFRLDAIHFERRKQSAKTLDLIAYTAEEAVPIKIDGQMKIETFFNNKT